MKKSLCILSIFMLAPIVTHAQKKIVYPKTDTVEQSDDYFGTKIDDPYRWLEDDTSDKTAKWVAQQNAVTNAYLDAIPYRDKLKNRIADLMNYPKYGAPSKKGDFYTFFKNDGLQNQAVLYVQKGLDGKAEVLLDPNKLSNDGTVALQAVEFSKNQKYMAYTVSASGSDWQTGYVMDFKTRKLISEKLENLKFSTISWNGDEGFYYNGHSKPTDEATKFSASTEFQKVFYHKIGTPQSSDILIYEDKDHPRRFVSPMITKDERYLILNISEGTDGNELKVKDLKNPKAEFQTLIKGFNTNASIVETSGEKLLLLTNQDAPNYKLVLIDPKMPAKENWKTVIPEEKEKLQNVTTAGGKLFASYLKDASTQMKQFDYSGKFEYEVKFPVVGTASGFSADKKETTLLYSFTSFIYPTTIFKYDIAKGTSEIYRKSEAKFNSENFITKQVFYTSTDGTKVPMFITHKKGLKLDGTNPTLLYAYGGFNISLTPSFSESNIAFIENGGIYCVASLRGGGEYGEEWHKGGMLNNKQNVFDDFITAAEYLISEKYTSSERLAIRGGSNGGLLVGAVMTQRPELFKVAIPQVGVLDMLRFHKFTVGWGWVVEYGSSANEKDFDNLIKYSPLHNLKPNVCYPATLITTADHDDRVVPAHSFKFAAELQKVQSCDNPTLIRIDSNAGHGAGKPTSKVIAEAADMWSFIFYNMGIKI